jgi:hypothetical protein
MNQLQSNDWTMKSTAVIQTNAFGDITPIHSEEFNGLNWPSAGRKFNQNWAKTTHTGVVFAQF